MSYDWSISIFGKAENGEALWEVANAAASESKIGWTEDFDAVEFPRMLDEAERQGEALVLTASDESGAFEGLTSTLQDAGLSYVVFVGDTGAEGYTNGFSWKPGMKGGFEFLLDGAKPVLTLEAVKQAARLGIDAVNQLVSVVEQCIHTGKIEVTPEAKEQYGEYSGHAWAADAPSNR